MTWRSLYKKLEEDYEVFGSATINLPPGDAVTAALKSEQEYRNKVDEWCQTYFIEGNASDPSQEVRYWLGWRLHWALGWFSPLAFGPFPDQLVEDDFISWLIIRCWPYGGVLELNATARSAIFDASLAQSLRRPGWDFGISFSR